MKKLAGLSKESQKRVQGKSPLDAAPDARALEIRASQTRDDDVVCLRVYVFCLYVSRDGGPTSFII